MLPRLSVVMSVYNGERYLREAIDSILSQTFEDYEFIIIDDGSTDGTKPILAEYAARDRRIVLTRNETNVGLTHSLNKGLALARGQYVARMDADDISLPDRFARQVAFLDEHPAIGVAGTWFQLMDAQGQLVPPVYEPPALPGFVGWCLYFYNPIAHPSVVMRREVVLRVGGYDPALARSQDHDLWCRLRGLTKLANVEAMLLYLRKHDSNISILQCEEGLRNSIRSLKALMARTLRRAVPAELIRYLYTRQYPNSLAIYWVAHLIYALARVALADPTVTETEKRLIRIDAARRLAEILHHVTTSPFDVRRWQLLVRIYRLEASLGRAELRGLWTRG